jgi:hypothetical protein
VAEEQPQSKPLVERANVWVSVFTAVAALVVGATQQRPASSVALAIGVMALLIGAAVFLLTARKGVQRRFSRTVRIATVITSVILVAGAITAFAVPASRGALVHDVLGFPSPAKDVRIADVAIRSNDNAYEIEVTTLNKLRTEELAHEIELRVETPCKPVSPADQRYRIGSEFRVDAADQNGSRLRGKAFREGDNGQFYSVVTGVILRCPGGGVGVTARLGVGAVLPPGQHSKITVEVPRTLEVDDTTPTPTLLSGSATPPPPRKVHVAVPMPVAGQSPGQGERLQVTLTVGERRAKITHTTG